MTVLCTSVNFFPSSCLQCLYFQALVCVASTSRRCVIFLFGVNILRAPTLGVGFRHSFVFIYNCRNMCLGFVFGTELAAVFSEVKTSLSRCLLPQFSLLSIHCCCPLCLHSVVTLQCNHTELFTFVDNMISYWLITPSGAFRCRGICLALGLSR